ncbi:VOC family protein [Pediococcus siamensis]|uniref:VOC family protein n=1 Tax=Pediococcus siamensis TaxID=381829 RepID=UPI0039A265B2
MKQDRPISFLSFPGTAEKAVNFYVETFPNSKLNHFTYYNRDEPDLIGKILNADFTLMGVPFYALDFTEAQAPVASWQTSQYIEFSKIQDFDHVFYRLSEKGNVLMGPDPMTPFDKVAWITDQFGITWQILHRAEQN